MIPDCTTIKQNISLNVFENKNTWKTGKILKLYNHIFIEETLT